MVNDTIFLMKKPLKWLLVAMGCLIALLLLLSLLSWEVTPVGSFKGVWPVSVPKTAECSSYEKHITPDIARNEKEIHNWIPIGTPRSETNCIMEKTKFHFVGPAEFNGFTVDRFVYMKTGIFSEGPKYILLFPYDENNLLKTMEEIPSENPS